jgi:hypothetical protein
VNYSGDGAWSPGLKKKRKKKKENSAEEPSGMDDALMHTCGATEN